VATLNQYWEREDHHDGSFTQTLSIAPICYNDNSVWKRNDLMWKQGDEQYPFLVEQAPMIVRMDLQGNQKVHPTRELDRWIEIGAPRIKTGAGFERYDYGDPSLIKDNNVIWDKRVNMRMNSIFGGHFLRFSEIELKSRPLLGIYTPPEGLIAFPIKTQGLDWKADGTIWADSKKVMYLKTPVVYDVANPIDTRPLISNTLELNGTRYLMLSLVDIKGMTRPLIDPTLTLQPDAAAGIDTYIWTSVPNNEYATRAYLDQLIPNYPALLLFSGLSAITDPNTVTSGTLYLYSTGTDYCSGNQSGYAYRILSANNGWIEACTWNYADGAGASDRWAGDTGSDGGADAGCSVSGTDYSSTALGTYTFINNSVDGTEYAISLNLAELKLMVATNVGIYTGTTTQGWQSHSSDSLTAGYRPKLVVNYTLPSAANFFRSPMWGRY